jgi:pyruvate dehydrogenase E1 component beta subunit
MFCDFAGVCFDQILNQAAKVRFLSNGRVKLPLVIRTTMGAGDGSGAMHSQSLHGLFASIPGLTVVCPSTPADAAGLLKAAIQSDDPVIFMENKQLYGVEGLVDEQTPLVPIGAMRTARSGSDVTIVAVSAMVQVALAAAQALANEGISAEVIDPRTIKPLDIGTINKSVEKTGHLLVLDEGAAFGSFADAVIAAVSEDMFGRLKAAPRKLTPPDTPVPYAVMAEKFWLPDTQDVINIVKTMMKGAV